MYNEIQKNEYLQYKKTDYLKDLFADSESYENQTEKDLCQMDTSELLHYLIKFDGYRNIEEKRRQLSNYIEWCVIKGYAPMNWISTKVVPNKDLLEMTVANRNEFYITTERFEEMKLRLNESGYGCYIASFFACVYEGIAGSNYLNLTHLRKKDIDREQNRIQLFDGTERNVSAGLIELLFQTAEITEITNERTVQYSSFLYPDSVWKIRRNAKVTASKVQRKFVFLMEELKSILNEEQVTKKAIENSGYFNRIYFRAKEEGIDLKDVVLDRKKEGKEENKSYDHYFNEEGWNMNMRKFVNSFRSYLNQV